MLGIPADRPNVLIIRPDQLRTCSLPLYRKRLSPSGMGSVVSI